MGGLLSGREECCAAVPASSSVMIELGAEILMMGVLLLNCDQNTLNGLSKSQGGDMGAGKALREELLRTSQ